MAEPRVVEFASVNDNRGGLIVADGLPFDAKRVFFREQNTYKTKFGGHAHKALEQMLICMSGRIVVDAVNPEGRKWRFNLRSPHCAVYVPALVWLDLEIAFGSTLMVLCSHRYDEQDYIREREAFDSGAFDPTFGPSLDVVAQI